MKMMISDTGEKQPTLYNIIQKWIAEGKVKVVGTVKGEGVTRGRSQVVYEVV